MLKTYEEFEKKLNAQNEKFKEDGVYKEFEVNKKDLLNPFFIEYLKNHDILELICKDENFYFNKEQTKRVLEIKSLLDSYFIYKPDFKFLLEVETRSKTCLNFGEINRNTRQLGQIFYSIEDVLNTNSKLDAIANQINNANIIEKQKQRNLSPFEKFLSCYAIVSLSIKYQKEEDESKKAKNRSYINAVNNLEGVCVAKAQTLALLLNLVGIKSCHIAASSGDFLNKNYEKTLFYGIKTIEELYCISKQCDMFCIKKRDRHLRLISMKEINNVIEKVKELKSKTVLTENYCNKKRKMGFMPFVANHSQTLVNLEDKRYNIKGQFVCDPTVRINSIKQIYDISKYCYINLNDYLTFYRPLELGLDVHYGKENKNILKALNFNKQKGLNKKHFRNIRKIEKEEINSMLNKIEFTKQEKANMATIGAALSSVGHYGKDISNKNLICAIDVVVRNLPKIFEGTNYFSQQKIDFPKIIGECEKL